MNVFVCECCGALDLFYVNPPDPPLCYGCRVRGRLCLHNLSKRAQNGDYKAHSSRTHWDESGASDPATCRWCLDKRPAGERTRT